MSVFAKSNNHSSSRRQIDVKGVRDGILLLGHHEYRLVMEASSINFELKSSDEQDVIIDTYQSVLNSLPCPVQIIARIREVDMARYLGDFLTASEAETDPVYREHMKSYTEFVRGLVATNNILSRRFYIVIPVHDTGASGWEGVREQLSLQADVVTQGLGRLGISCRRLGSLEVLDLFYRFYHPELSKRQPLREQTMEHLTQTDL